MGGLEGCATVDFDWGGKFERWVGWDGDGGRDTRKGRSFRVISNNHIPPFLLPPHLPLTKPPRKPPNPTKIPPKISKTSKPMLSPSQSPKKVSDGFTREFFDDIFRKEFKRCPCLKGIVGWSNIPIGSMD